MPRRRPSASCDRQAASKNTSTRRTPRRGSRIGRRASRAGPRSSRLQPGTHRPAHGHRAAATRHRSSPRRDATRVKSGWTTTSRPDMPRRACASDRAAASRRSTSTRRPAHRFDGRACGSAARAPRRGPNSRESTARAVCARHSRRDNGSRCRRLGTRLLAPSRADAPRPLLRARRQAAQHRDRAGRPDTRARPRTSRRAVRPFSTPRYYRWIDRSRCDRRHRAASSA